MTADILSLGQVYFCLELILFITKPPTGLLKTELSVTFGSVTHLVIWSE